MQDLILKKKKKILMKDGALFWLMVFEVHSSQSSGPTGLLISDDFFSDRVWNWSGERVTW